MTRLGVSIRPSRSGLSPAQRINVLTASIASSSDGLNDTGTDLSSVFLVYLYSWVSYSAYLSIITSNKRKKFVFVDCE